MVVLGGVMLSVLAKVRGFKLGRGRWFFLKAIKIHSTPSFELK
jgi:hypothetical protein